LAAPSNVQARSAPLCAALAGTNPVAASVVAENPESGDDLPVPLQYQSGEEVQKGDRVLFHGEPGEIDFVVDGVSGDPDMDWYFTNYGPGVMVLEPKYFGSAYVVPADSEDVVFVSRSVGSVPGA
jgi:hypothetical protein